MPPKSSPKDANSGVKRQRTIEDMFPVKGSSSSGSVAKKPKLSSDTDSDKKTSPSKVMTTRLLSTTPKLNSIPFSLSEWEGSLSDEERNLLTLEIEVFGKSWIKVLHPELKKQYFLNLKRFLWELGVRGSDTPTTVKVYPPAKQIYTWSNTPLGRVKCVIIGQDPYHGPRQAHGLCFSVQRGVAVPPSLRNIYAEIKANYPEFVIPTHGDLSAWAANGVLMLNTCLTVNASEAGSHANKGWEQFTEQVINAVDKWGGANLPLGGQAATGTCQGVKVVFLCWGAWAAKRVDKLNKTKHLILTSAHPSPLSAHRGFLGNRHFKLANEWLEKKYGPEGKIDWCNLDPANVATA